MSKPKSTAQILKKRTKQNQRSVIAKIVRWSCWTIVVMMVCGLLGGAGAYFYLRRSLQLYIPTTTARLLNFIKNAAL